VFSDLNYAPVLTEVEGKPVEPFGKTQGKLMERAAVVG
jgi:hypothetical protein